MTSKLNLKRILNKIKRESNIIAVIVLFVFFLGSFFIMKDITVAEQDVPNYSELIKNPYKEYEKLIRKTNVKKLIESEQFMEMKYSDDLIKEVEDNNIKEGKNIFLKLF